MLNREEFHWNLELLDNLLLLKRAYDIGMDMKLFKEFSSNYGEFHYNSQLWSNFTTAIEHLFEIFELYDPHERDEKEIMEKKYWLDSVGYQYGCQSTGVLVLMDDRIKPFQSESFGGYDIMDHWYSGFGESFHLDRTIVIAFDEDEGPISWTEVFGSLVSIYKQMSVKESVNYEMAI